ncbi:hypothetical protein CP01DC11_1166, partial [Chlamydia psittaci 01DC11]
MLLFSFLNLNCIKMNPFPKSPEFGVHSKTIELFY